MIPKLFWGHGSFSGLRLGISAAVCNILHLIKMSDGLNRSPSICDLLCNVAVKVFDGNRQNGANKNWKHQCWRCFIWIVREVSSIIFSKPDCPSRTILTIRSAGCLEHVHGMFSVLANRVPISTQLDLIINQLSALDPIPSDRTEMILSPFWKQTNKQTSKKQQPLITFLCFSTVGYPS